MDKFWKWLITEKDEAGYVPGIGYTMNGVDFIPNSMLVGYMMEYLLRKGRISFRQIGIWLAEEIKSNYFKINTVALNGDNYLDVVYHILEKKINSLKPLKILPLKTLKHGEK